MSTGEIFLWRKGALEKTAELTIKQMVEMAHPGATRYEKEEVISHIRDQTLIDMAGAEAKAWPYFAMANGVIDIRPGGSFADVDAFAETHPDTILAHRLPVEYDPQARCPDYWRFLTRALPSVDDQVLLWDHFASILDKRPVRRRALLLFGPKSTGKTTQLNVETALVGAENVAAIPLDQLCGEDHFAAANLQGKLLSVWDDLPDIPLRRLGQFKVLTGGGLVSARHLYHRQFDFRPYAKLHYTANKAPPVRDVTDDAWWDRVDCIEWKVPVEKPDKEAAARLTEPHELSGIFNQLLKVARRQITNGRFRIVRDPAETQDVWLGQAEPARVFITSQVFSDPNSWVTHAELYRAWNGWRQKRKPIPAHVSTTRFNELVASTYGIERTSRKGPKREKAWVGIGYRGQLGTKGQAELDAPAAEAIEVRQPLETAAKHRRGFDPTAVAYLFGEVGLHDVEGLQ